MQEATGMEAAAVEQYMASMTEEELIGYAAQGIAEQVKAEYAAKAAEAIANLTTEELAGILDGAMATLTEEELLAGYGEYMPPVVSDGTLKQNLTKFGHADEENPTGIALYAETFEEKDRLTDLIAAYNDACIADGRDEDVISYTDYVALMMSSISTIINVISYVLIVVVVTLAVKVMLNASDSNVGAEACKTSRILSVLLRRVCKEGVGSERTALNGNRLLLYRVRLDARHGIVVKDRRRILINISVLINENQFSLGITGVDV
jgi:hypothetical protein